MKRILHRQYTSGKRGRDIGWAVLGIGLVLTGCATPQARAPSSLAQQTYPVQRLKPIDSAQRLKVEDRAPDFELPATDGSTVRLRDFRGSRNVILSFVPAAWTPVCSSQWPAYEAMGESLRKDDTVFLGITTDNIPTLYAWCNAMDGISFPVLSDFNPHGAVATRYGILRSDGTAERALFLIDKGGVIRYMDIHDINSPPAMEPLLDALERLVSGTASETGD